MSKKVIQAHQAVTGISQMLLVKLWVGSEYLFSQLFQDWYPGHFQIFKSCVGIPAIVSDKCNEQKSHEHCAAAAC